MIALSIASNLLLFADIHIGNINWYDLVPLNSFSTKSSDLISFSENPLSLASLTNKSFNLLAASSGLNVVKSSSKPRDSNKLVFWLSIIVLNALLNLAYNSCPLISFPLLSTDMFGISSIPSPNNSLKI